MLIETLKRDLVESLKRGETARVETLRYLLAAVHDAAFAKYGLKLDTALTDQDVLSVIKGQVKTHRESIEAFAKGKRLDLVQRETAQLAMLERYLPKPMTDKQLKERLVQVAASGETNFGLLMKQAMAKVAGGADGGRVAAMLKEMLPKQRQV